MDYWHQRCIAWDVVYWFTNRYRTDYVLQLLLICILSTQSYESGRLRLEVWACWVYRWPSCKVVETGSLRSHPNFGNRIAWRDASRTPGGPGPLFLTISNSLKQQLLIFSNRSTINRENERANKQTTCWLFRSSDSLEVKESILSQSRTKRSKISIALSHEYLIVLNSWDIWHGSIDRSIDDETFLTMSANRKRSRDSWKSKWKRDEWNRMLRDRKLTRNAFANMCWFKCFEFDRFRNRWDRRMKI